jgi:rhodanese-related sulfurtransferase
MRHLHPRELKAWLDDPQRDKPLLLDVREPWEFEQIGRASCRERVS